MCFDLMRDGRIGSLTWTSASGAVAHCTTIAETSSKDVALINTQLVENLVKNGVGEGNILSVVVGPSSIQPVGGNVVGGGYYGLQSRSQNTAIFVAPDGLNAGRVRVYWRFWPLTLMLLTPPEGGFLPHPAVRASASGMLTAPTRARMVVRGMRKRHHLKMTPSCGICQLRCST